MAKVRAIIIEGEMTPTELKEYVDAFWHGAPANTSRPVAVLQEDYRDVPMETLKEISAKAAAREEAKTAPAPAPEAAPAVVESAAPEAPAAPDERIQRFLACTRVSGFVQLLIEEGKTTLDEILAECRVLQPAIPQLQRLGAALEDRITRTFEGMQ